MKNAGIPTKHTMNLFYKPDRTTKPATAALYILFALTVLLGLSKVLVYDLWQETRTAEEQRTAAQEQLAAVLSEMADYDAVQERYSRYAATPDERATVDRMEVLALLDSAVAAVANVENISIQGGFVQMQFSGVTLAQTAEIVKTLEASPLVAGTTVNTASTTEGEGAVVQTHVLIELKNPAEEAAE